MRAVNFETGPESSRCTGESSRCAGVHYCKRSWGGEEVHIMLLVQCRSDRETSRCASALFRSVLLQQSNRSSASAQYAISSVQECRSLVSVHCAVECTSREQVVLHV